MKQLLLLLLLSACVSQRLSAQKPAHFNIGEIQTIQSSVLNEKRTLNIYLPEGYATAGRTFPVIYLLDGSANEDFLHIAGLTQFLTMIDTLPPSIIVGIANKDRRRDFTFPTGNKEDQRDFPTAGKSENFIHFIEKELQPFVRQHYRTNDSTTLIGQSLGGLLAAEVLLKQPALFHNYVIVSPSLWWDSESLLIRAPHLLIAHPDIDAKVFIAVGKEGEQMQDAASGLAAALQDAKMKHLFVFFTFFPKENHLTILHNAVYEALMTINKKRKRN